MQAARALRTARCLGRVAVRHPPAARPLASTAPASTNPFTNATLPLSRAVLAAAARRLHTSSTSLKRHNSKVAHNNEEIPQAAPETDFSRMDVLGNTPPPSTAVDTCLPAGFALSNGIRVDGSGVLLVGGQAFAWRPWNDDKRLVNARGQWEVGESAWGVLGLVWPRPDLLILGLGPEMRPLSPETKRHIASLGMRVEVLDTRNAAAQFNLLATERGVGDVAAAMIPIGWAEGVGAR